jgi:hypothetical protein
MFLCIPALAIIKIIFERVENLHPWGNFLARKNLQKEKKSKNLRNHYEEKN